jgi:hypothetical protein
MTSREVRTIVNRGAKLLDTLEPKWAKKVKLQKFDLGSGLHCVLGQVHGEFTTGLMDLAHKALVKQLNGMTVKLDKWSDLRIDAPYYGFDASGTSQTYDADMELLSAQWVKAITKRLEGK